jgi:hypothetical protein
MFFIDQDKLIQGDLETWAVGYHKVLLHGTLTRQTYPYPIMQYDYSKRHLLYAYVNDRILADVPVDYLEFGVAQGDSLRRWININQHPQSRFFGFDTFEGLPEAWFDNKVGAFSNNGAFPSINDSRITYHKGLFQKTLRPFLSSYRQQNRMVIHLDADLHSATLYTLMNLDPYIKPGTILIFDEFIAEHEFAAFYQWSTSCYRDWKIVAARNDYLKLAIEILR